MCKGGGDAATPLKARDRIYGLVFLVAVPYFKRKLDRMYDLAAGPMTAFGRESPPEAPAPIATQRRQRHNNENSDSEEDLESEEDELIPNTLDVKALLWKSAKTLFLYGYPAVHILYEGSSFVYQVSNLYLRLHQL